jgi:hypothetical protein
MRRLAAFVAGEDFWRRMRRHHRVSAVLGKPLRLRISRALTDPAAGVRAVGNVRARSEYLGERLPPYAPRPPGFFRGHGDRHSARLWHGRRSHILRNHVCAVRSASADRAICLRAGLGHLLADPGVLDRCCVKG